MHFGTEVVIDARGFGVLDGGYEAWVAGSGENWGEDDGDDC